MFYAAFRAAVQDVRSTRGRKGEAYSGSSEVFFGNQINDTYTKIDAADEALDRGNARLARQLASAALAKSPRNADALVMRAGAAYAMNDMGAAAQDARAAMQLDPNNQQARALVDLSGNGPTAGAGALANAAATGGDFAAAANGGPAGSADGAPAAVSLAPAAVSLSAAPAQAAVGRLVMPLSAPPSPTPALGVRLSSDLTTRAASGIGLDPQASIQQLDRAIALDPRNVDALDWRGYAADKQGDYRDALAAADRALEINPRDARAYFNRAYARAGQGDKAGALDALRQAAAIDPAYQPTLQNALQLAQSGDMTLLFKDTGAGFRKPVEPGVFQQLLNMPPSRLMALVGGALVLVAASQFAFNN